MALNAPVDREFNVHPAGFVRDKIVLANFREGLRKLRNPETGQPFTAEEIARATRPKSRWYIGAQALDDYAQGEQRNALYLADQIRLERASSGWLLNYHGRLFNAWHLAATGGSGTALATGVPGTIVVGSTTPNDPNAHKARSPDGSLFQAFLSTAVQGDGTVPVTMIAVSTGVVTNIPAGTTLTWTQKDPNLDPLATAVGTFSGGTDRETDAELAARIASIMQHRPGAGNDAHFRAWGREASNAIEEVFVYPCAFHSGSVLVAITQKRGNVAGPLGRVPSAGTLAAAIAYLTPPTSPVVPPRPHVIVTPTALEGSDLVFRLSMQKGTASGWFDTRPFPTFHATTPQVTAVTDTTHFQLTSPGDATLPGGASSLSGGNAPAMMVWDATVSAWIELDVQSITTASPGVFNVVLGAGLTLSAGQFVSPMVTRHAIISRAVVAYFDALGPGELFASSEPRAARCVRFPYAVEERPYRAGATVATRVIEALGGTSADAVLESLSVATPSYPTDLTLGPRMLVPGKVAIYPL